MHSDRLSFGLLLVMMVFWGTGCALGDLEEASPQRANVAVPPPPETIFAGSCETPQTLDQWLQPMVTYALPEFQASLDHVISLDEAVLRRELVTLARLRETLVVRPTPDCAVEIHSFFLDMLNKAIETIQLHINGEDVDLSRALIGLVGDIDVLHVELDILMAQLESQYHE